MLYHEYHLKVLIIKEICETLDRCCLIRIWIFSFTTKNYMQSQRLFKSDLHSSRGVCESGWVSWWWGDGFESDMSGSRSGSQVHYPPHFINLRPLFWSGGKRLILYPNLLLEMSKKGFTEMSSNKVHTNISCKQNEFLISTTNTTVYKIKKIKFQRMSKCCCLKLL